MSPENLFQFCFSNLAPDRSEAPPNDAGFRASRSYSSQFRLSNLAPDRSRGDVGL
jgi:hypothetical protein